jgi:hypothetical protein
MEVEVKYYIHNHEDLFKIDIIIINNYDMFN